MNTAAQTEQDQHFKYLSTAYGRVGDQTWSAADFTEENLAVSRDLFTPESLQRRNPQPKELEVYALLSGLAFPEEFSCELHSVQMRISDLLGERLHYWVAPQNLGIEYCVFKWPEEPFQGERLDQIRKVLDSIRQPCFQLSIGGVQINPDGCVVARGFDQGAVLFRIREQLKADIPSLPARQSGWAHIPLGRILEPLGRKRFSELARLIKSLSEWPIAKTEIRVMKLVHETRWYMENKTILAHYPLLCSEGMPKS
ncbi:MAG: hypothetical protein KDI68_05930 [Gammaproteobacteria bacterium]|nr:hypothetical protein [Gammaproteobacteria bacterium]